MAEVAARLCGTAVFIVAGLVTWRTTESAPLGVFAAVVGDYATTVAITLGGRHGSSWVTGSDTSTSVARGVGALAATLIVTGLVLYGAGALWGTGWGAVLVALAAGASTHAALGGSSAPTIGPADQTERRQ